MMNTRLVIDGNSVYEIDEECLEARQEGWGRKKKRSSAADGRQTERKSQKQEPLP